MAYTYVSSTWAFVLHKSAGMPLWCVLRYFSATASVYRLIFLDGTEKHELCLVCVFVQLHFSTWIIRIRKVHMWLLLGFAVTAFPVHGILLHKQNQLFFTY